MSEMIERVAAAISSETGLNRRNAVCLVAARAAIEAMREPTKDMGRQAAAECSTTDLADEDDFENHYAEVWRTMIDTALNPVPEVVTR